MAPPTQQEYGDNVNAARFGDYKFFVPPLPAQLNTLNTVYLHCDPEVRPYIFADFVDEFERLSILGNIRACGPYLRNHFWEVCFKTPDDRLRLLEARELEVKRRKCFVIDPQAKYIHVILHWVPRDVTVKCVRKVLRRFGRVCPMEPELKFAEKPQNTEWGTLLASITLKEGLSTDNFPHKVSFKNGMASLAVVVGGTPTCLRCSQKGHLRKYCRAPQCGLCARVGHFDFECGNDNVALAAPAAEVADAQPADAPRVEAAPGADYLGVESVERSSPAASESVAESEAMDVTCDQAAPDSPGRAEPLRDVTAGGDHAFAEGSLSVSAASESIAESHTESMDLTHDEATPGTSSGVELRREVLAGGDRAEASQSAPAASESSSEDAGSQSEAMNASGDEAEPGPSTKEQSSKAKSYLRKYKPKKKKKKKRQKKR